MVAVFVLAAATLAQGQADPDSVKRRNNCRLAVQVLETRHPAPKRTWAKQYIVFCSTGERASVYLSAARVARHLTDTTEVGDAILAASGFLDGELFQEVVSIAGDRGTSVTARVFAFMALTEIDDPDRFASYGGFVGGLDQHGLPRGNCTSRSMHRRLLVAGPTPLPADYRQQITVVSKRVARDETEPADVRSAARCV